MDISVEEAQKLLREGKVVALPTETVYGLAALANNKTAIDKVFALKKRAPTNPLTIHVASIADITPYLENRPPFFKELADAFWPGPLTMVMPIDITKVLEVVRAGLYTTGFRVPDHPMTRSVLEAVGPVVMPSANLSNGLSATSSEHIVADFGKELPIVNGGVSQHGFESTVIEYKNGSWCLLREGMVKKEEVQKITGALIADSVKNKRLGLDFAFFKTLPEDFSGTVLGWRGKRYPSGAQVYILGDPANTQEVTHQFYDRVRQVIEQGGVKLYIDQSGFEDNLQLDFLLRRIS